ncbi:MAG: hypothetical protein P8Z78_00915 [Gammaproteobacteria bacterium]
MAWLYCFQSQPDSAAKQNDHDAPRDEILSIVSGISSGEWCGSEALQRRFFRARWT